MSESQKWWVVCLNEGKVISERDMKYKTEGDKAKHEKKGHQCTIIPATQPKSVQTTTNMPPSFIGQVDI